MRRLPHVLFWLFLVALVLSGINPHDQFTWFLEVAPAILGVGVLVATYRRFPLSDLTYCLIFVHALILAYGGHYTYAQAPLGDWLSSVFGWARNNYDKIGHFAQGFIPAIIVREILLRTSPLKRGAWLSTLVVAFCLAVSALYELFEWLMAALSGGAADAFLGTQGYVWDTQSDMLLALVGAIVALLLLSRLHDWSLQQRGYAE